MAARVEVTKRALKQLSKAPHHVAGKFQLWVREVERTGIEQVRRRPGFHDEPLEGQRAGQRSIRLSRQWRAIYTQHDGDVTILLVQEVSPHDY